MKQCMKQLLRSERSIIYIIKQLLRSGRSERWEQKDYIILY